MIRYPYPQINKIRDFVQTELVRRKSQPENGMVDITSPFVKMTSALTTEHGNWLTLGLHGYASNENIFDTVYDGDSKIGYSYGPNGKVLVSVTSLFNNDSIAMGTHPIPGIVNVTVNKRQLGKPTETVVSWKCYDVSQLEYLRRHFLMPGVHVVLEWGQSFALNNPNITTLDFADVSNTGRTLASYILDGHDVIMNSYVQNSHGNYDFVVGIISDFGFVFDGSKYDCTTTIMSPGESLYGMSNTETITVADKNPYRTSLTDYFKHGGEFDLYINSDKIAPTDKFHSAPSIDLGALPGGVNNTTAKQIASDFSITVEDINTYISWKALISQCIPTLVATMHNSPNIDLAFLKLPQLDTVTSGPFVGYSKYLLSTDITTMILINKQARADIAKVSGLTEFIGTDSYKALLSQGVYINVGAIKECILTTNTLFDSIQMLIERMSNATGGFWQLQLLYDTDFEKYEIRDIGLTMFPEDKNFYTFNLGTKSELVTLQFSGRMSAAQKTQAMLTNASDLPDNFGRASEPSDAFVRFNDIETRDIIRDYVSSRQFVDSNSSRQSTSGVLKQFTIGTLLQPAAQSRVDNDDNFRLAHKVAGGVGTSGTRVDVGSTATAGRPVGANTARPGWFNPLPGRIGGISSPYGKVRQDGKPHDGVDIPAVSGTPIYAPASGIVTTKFDTAGGNEILIAHDNGYKTGFAHLSRYNVSNGQYVSAGQVIGYVGATGDASGPHLHMTAYDVTGERMNPANIFGPQITGMNPTQVTQAQTGFLPFTSQSILRNLPAVAPDGTLLDSVSAQNQQVADQQKEADFTQQSQERDALIQAKYNEGLMIFFETNESAMRNKMALEADQLNHPSSLSYPIATQMEISCTLLGQAGFSPGDCFYIDKFPTEYKKHGLWQITGIEDNITSTGWLTTLTLRYKLIWR